MKGGPSVEVLLDLALGANESTAQKAAEVLKTQVFLYDADTDRLAAAHADGQAIATDILKAMRAPTSSPSCRLWKTPFRWSPT